MIRELAADDLDLARDLRLALHQHHAALPVPPGFTPRPFDGSWDTWRETVATALTTGTATVLLHEPEGAGAPDGMAYVRMLDPATVGRPFLVATGPHAELATLVVAESARGTGVGGRLADAANVWARERGAVAIHIGVRATNVDARRLYVRRGAEPVFETLVEPL